jgi:hypothetical protein
MELTFNREDAKEIIYGDNEDFEIIQEEITSVDRWTYNTHVIVKQVSTGKYFSSNYSQGNTENQDSSPYEYDDPDFIEVVPYETTVTKYKYLE